MNLLLAGICIVGILSRYDQGPTDAVRRNRSIPGRTAYTLPADLSGIDGFIAVESCHDLGQVWNIEWEGHAARVLAWDCSGDRETTEWMRRGNILGEIDYYTAERWGTHLVRRGMRDAIMCLEEQ